MINPPLPLISAFVSCSLRTDDLPFINFVEQILRNNGISPFGTVGRHSAAPINPAEHIKQNIASADFVVIIATARYIQKDIHSGKLVYGLSEMLHVESGLAYMLNKPVVVFVKEGTNVGGFLPNITQYITLNGQQDDLIKKQLLIKSLFNSIKQIIQQRRANDSNKNFGNLVKTGLAIFGGFVIADSFLTEEEPKPKKKAPMKRRKH